jgi:hypothetical protein
VIPSSSEIEDMSRLPRPPSIHFSVKALVRIFCVCIWALQAPAFNSYNVSPNTDTIVNEFGICHSLRHTLAQNLFVPTKTQAEWEAFLAHCPSQVTVSNCAAPTPRLISTSHYSDWSGTTYKSPATMSRTNWEISTSGVVNGDLLIVVANIDNGSNTLWPNPFATGFTQLYQKFYGNDGQTLQISYKIANNEPASYSGTYVTPSVSYSSVISLIAISGANQMTPIHTSNIDHATGANKSSPITATSTGVTTTVPNCTLVFVSSIDWMETIATSSFTTPAGFTPLVQTGDRGTSTWDWTSTQIYFKKTTASGASGSISSVETAAGRTGIDLRGVIAVCP